MNKLLILLAMVLWLTACNEENGGKEEASNEPKNEIKEDPIERRKVELGEYAQIIDEIEKIREESVKGISETQQAKDEVFQQIIMRANLPSIEPMAMELFMHNDLDVVANQQMVEMYTEVLARISKGEEPGEIINYWSTEMGGLQQFIREQTKMKKQLAEDLKKQLETIPQEPQGDAVIVK